MKPFSQACENNKQPIINVLKRVFANRCHVLEIGSGTGQHAAFFSENLPHLIWQTSDLPENHPGINAWLDASPAQNLRRPLAINADDLHWPVAKVDAVFSANTLHIMSWESVVNLFSGIGRHTETEQGAVLAIYGPFKYNGNFTTESNRAFDLWLKQRAVHQGIRDFEKINELAEKIGFKLQEDNPMPANNQLLIWLRDSTG